MTRLESLNMNRNALTGSLPSFIGPLKQLQFLDLSRNALTGAFPPKFCASSKDDRSHPLASLLINLNSLSGVLDISSCISLSFFDASSNNLTSVLAPPGYNKLNIISMANNSISEFSSLFQSNYIVDMNADYQRWNNTVLAPTIPNVGNLKQIRSLSMFDTSLRGKLPPKLMEINSLQVLSLGGNYLTGTIPVIQSPLQKVRLKQ